MRTLPLIAYCGGGAAPGVALGGEVGGVPVGGGVALFGAGVALFMPPVVASGVAGGVLGAAAAGAGAGVSAAGGALVVGALFMLAIDELLAAAIFLWCEPPT